jgi:NAD(P)-dependent dehydrogenase (short-subunit alcohol dehydrogenase family)
MKLLNRVAVVTGSAQGIGAAIAEEFLKEGAVVYGIDLRDQPAQENARFHPRKVDLTDHGALEALVNDITAEQSRMDILVNNAAVSYCEDLSTSSLAHWRHTQAVNIESQYVLCKLVSPHMARAGWGRIVNLASTQAIATEAKAGAYTASKGAIISFTKSLAVELAPFGINANAIAPGCIHTPMSFVNGVDETKTDYFQTWYVKERKIPLARPGEPAEVARVAVFLASEDATYITGHTLVVDGGLTITF